MLYILTPTHAEAEPYIGHFQLKKDMSVHLFSLYRSTNICLCITGSEPAYAAAAIGYLAGGYALSDASGGWLLFLQTYSAGVENEASTDSTHAAHAGDTARIGESIRYPHTIKNTAGRAFYPDMLYNHPFTECEITSDTAACVYQAASKCLPPHRILLLQTPDTVKEQSIILPWLEGLHGLMTSEAHARSVFNTEEQRLMDAVAASLKLTLTLRLALEKHCAAYKARGGDLQIVLSPCAAAVCETKQDGKNAFARLTRFLME